MARAHSHPDVEINVVLAGTIRYFFSGRFHEIRAGEAAVFWAGMPHQTLAKASSLEGIWMTLPLPWLLRWKNAGTLAERLMAGNMVSFASSVTTREAFAQWVQDFHSHDAALREILAAEIECLLSRVSLNLASTPRKRSTPPSGMEKLTAVTSFLGRNYRDDLSVSTIAHAVRLHPKYLLTLFRRSCGMTLWEYVTRLRLAQAQRLLLTTNRTVLDIALDAGFGSASAFYQAFRRYELRPPSQFRADGKAGQIPLQ